MKRHQEPQNSLFLRIVLQLTLPLILLASVLTALQVNIQLASLNKVHQLESRWEFSAFEERVRKEFVSAGTEKEVAALDKRLKRSLNADVSFFNYLKGTPVDPKDNWDSFDVEQIEKTITGNQGKKNYHVAINRQTKQITAYMALNRTDNENIYIARAGLPLSDFKDAIGKSSRYLIAMLILIIIVGIVMGYNMSRSIIRPIQLLSKATREIAGGKLGKQVKIDTGDEIEILANTFNDMSQSLQDMQKKAVDANPLTGLSGNQGIFQELKKRIFERQKFVLFHADLDRFKVFNDHYGLAKGDEAIKHTAELLKLAVAEKGAPDDYVGHQGGDDYVIITRPAKAMALAQHIVNQFDKIVVPSLYPKEDIARGYTVHEDRRYFTETGEQRTQNFPLLAISLAGVSTAKKDLADYFQCMTLAAEIKKEAKKTIQSSFIIKEDF